VSRPVLKLNKNRFRVARTLVNGPVFDEWLRSEGVRTWRHAQEQLSARWFFGKRRARNQLLKAAQRELSPNASFAERLTVELNKLPEFIGRNASNIRRRNLKDLYTIHEERTLVVVPRGIVHHDFGVTLVRALEGAPELDPFPGLARRVLQAAGEEAERLLFNDVEKRGLYPETLGRGAVVAVDRDVKWQINGFDGHYVFGWTADETVKLTEGRSLRRFKGRIKEALKGQHVHLVRLNGMDRRHIVETLTERQTAAAIAAKALKSSQPPMPVG
jgi:hypothetical protein